MKTTYCYKCGNKAIQVNEQEDFTWEGDKILLLKCTSKYCKQAFEIRISPSITQEIKEMEIIQ